MNNFLKMEKEHITNENSLKTVMDYKYPFDTKLVSVSKDTQEM
jgi:hypothetical protein